MSEFFLGLETRQWDETKAILSPIPVNPVTVFPSSYQEQIMTGTEVVKFMGQRIAGA